MKAKTNNEDYSQPIKKVATDIGENEPNINFEINMNVEDENSVSEVSRPTLAQQFRTIISRRF